MAGNSGHSAIRDISEIGRDTLVWCASKGIQNWMSGFAAFVTLVLGIVGILAACKNEQSLNSVLHSWQYLSCATLVPLSQFLSCLIGVASKGQLDRIAKENVILQSRLNKVELIEQNMESIFGMWLKLILEEVKIDGENRASFYVWDDKGSAGNEFVYIARESSDPVLKRKGRDRFPGNQGVISEAWHANSGRASYFAAKTVKDDVDVVNDMMNRYGFTQIEANGLTMKSRVILGHVIVGGQGKLGIVVIESLQSVSKREKKDLYQKRCAEVVKKVTPHITRLFEIYSNSLFKQENPTEDSQ